MTVNELMTALVDELAAGGVPDVLTQPLTLAAVWDDLARLAGEAPPRWVAAHLEAPHPQYLGRVYPDRVEWQLAGEGVR